MEIDDAPNMGYLLGAMESEDVEVREAALGWLSSAPWRDDDLAVATARAVPELARLAHRLPGHRADLLSLLSGIAARDEWPDGADPAQPAVTAELPSLLPFAHDDDPEVRDALLPLLVTCRPPQALPLLRTRLAEEPDPAVRGHVVTALALLEPGEGGWRHELLADPEPKVRLAAAEDLLRTTAPPFPPGLVDACAQAYAARPHDLDEAHLAPAPHRRFADRLLDDPEAALRATAGGVPLAFEIAEHWRDREIEVLPWALRDLQDYYEDLDQLGRLCCVLPAELHARVRERVRPYLDRDFVLRAAAVAALARAHAPEAVEEAVRLVEEEPFPPVPPGPHRVVRAVEAVAEVFGPGALPVARAVARRVGRGHAHLIRVLEHYPEVALEVVDEVAALVPRYESGHAWAAITLLGALGPAAGDGAARALRDEATQGCHSSVAVYAAVAHHRVSGDPGLALSLLEREGPASWPEFAGGLGPAAGPLLPYLEPRLAPGDPVGAGSAAARAIWQITGRTEDTLEPLARCAAADNHHTRRIASVTALTEMGLLPRFAVAPLRAAAESPRRVVRDLGDRSGLHPDYRLRTAVRTLLATAEVIDARD